MEARKIFISYRRGDTAGHAGRLMDGLAARFGESSVFMDLDSIAPGVDYEQRIRDELSACRVALVLIGDDWLSVTDAEGRRRIDDPRDWVRLEVAEALRRDDLTIVPVLVEGAAMPTPDELPEAIARLSSVNAIELSDQRWRYDVERLSEVIRGSLGSGRRLPVLSALPRWAPVAILAAAVLIVAAVVLILNGSDEPQPAPPAPQQGPPDFNQLEALGRTVIPAHSIGPVALGDTVATVQDELSFLGAGKQQLGDDGSVIGLSWRLGDPDQQLQVAFDAAGKAVQISSTSPLFSLEGVSLDAGLDRVGRVLGPSWTTLRCNGFTVLFLDTSANGPSTVWTFANPGSQTQTSLSVQSYEVYPGNAPC